MALRPPVQDPTAVTFRPAKRHSVVDDARQERDRKDQELHHRLVTAHDNGQVVIFTNFEHLNRGGSPVFSVFDNVGPLLFMILGSVALLFTSLLVGVGTLLASALFYIFAVRPWIARRLRERTVDQMLSGLPAWRRLWRFGGVVVALTSNPRIGCAAPHSDWRSLARKFVADRQGPGIGVDRDSVKASRRGPAMPER